MTDKIDASSAGDGTKTVSLEPGVDVAPVPSGIAEISGTVAESGWSGIPLEAASNLLKALSKKYPKRVTSDSDGNFFFKKKPFLKQSMGAFSVRCGVDAEGNALNVISLSLEQIEASVLAAIRDNAATDDEEKAATVDYAEQLGLPPSPIG